MMEHSFDRIELGGQNVPVQGGNLRIVEERVISWLGTPPSEEELKPRMRMKMSWDRIILPPNTEVYQEVEFYVSTRGGDEFAGTLILTGSLVQRGYLVSEHNPLVIRYEEAE